MDNAAAHSLMETVGKINQMVQRARSGEPTVDDYLRAVSEEPRTEWFTGLLREKNEELRKERERFDGLVAALRAWHLATNEGESPESEADARLVKVLRRTGIVEA
jgi:hypothetical protein